MSCLIKRLITLTVPIRYRTVNIFDENNKDVTATALFSWSTDTVCWTNFVTLEQYNKLAPNIETDYYLRILIISGFKTLALDGKVVDCYTICLYNENPYLKDLCLNQSIDFYANLDCALQMYTQLSDLVCCMVGIPCYYFRVLPDQNTADLTFKEYVLHNVVDMKFLKLVCQDGSMPSSKPQMTEFDFDWDTDWEVEMSKTAFAKAFGDTAFPKQRDIIWIPLMKRMWEVNAAYDEKATVSNDTIDVADGDYPIGESTLTSDDLDFWNMYKEDKPEHQKIRDEQGLKYEETEKKIAKEEEEQVRESGVIQMEAPLYQPENLYNLTITDAVREVVSNTELKSVKSHQLNHRAAIVTRDVYNFINEDSVIVYQHRYCSDSGTLAFIISPRDTNTAKTIFKAGNIKVDMHGAVISFNGMSQTLEPGYTYMVHCKWNRASFTTELNIYPYICTAPAGTKPYYIKPDMYIFDFENATCLQTGAYNNDFISQHPVPVILSPAPHIITNIKMYDSVLELNDIVKESIKYATKDTRCVINDVARPFEDTLGFLTK